MANLSSLKTAVYVAGTYSLRRLIRNPEGKKVPIISFRTQQRPIFHTLAQIAVLEPYATEMIGRYSKEKSDVVKHGLGTSFKAHLAAVTQKSLIELSERCGSQGLFGYNQIIESQLGCRGISIAEGDVLVLCIRKFLHTSRSRFPLTDSRSCFGVTNWEILHATPSKPFMSPGSA